MATTTTNERGALSEEQLETLLGLLGNVDSAELKLTIPESHQQETIQRLGMDPLDAQIRQVFFFDTPDLTLNPAGLVARARRVQGKGDDSVVKLRPVAPDELPESERTHVTVEVDAMPGAYVCSASLKGVPDANVRRLPPRHLRRRLAPPGFGAARGAAAGIHLRARNPALGPLWPHRPAPGV